MDDLPLLVEHGGWLWIAALIALCIGTGAALLRWQRWRATYLARARADGIDIGGERSVRGTLGGAPGGEVQRASLLRSERRWGGAVQVSLWRGGRVWIEAGERQILLDGPIEVVAGSGVGRVRRGAMPAGSESSLAAERADGVVSWLSAGDEVFATGERLERAPAGDGGYRDGASVWRLVGTEAEPIRVAAREPRGAGAGPRALAAIASIALGVTAGGFVFARSCGAGWQRDCAEATAVDTTELSSVHACSLAAAMPGSRDRALASLLVHLDRDPVRDERTIGRVLGLSREIDRCSGTIERLIAHDRYEEAEQEARACLRLGDARRALVLQGRFADALAMPVLGPDGDPAVAGAALWIAGGSWEQAAAAVSQRRGLLSRAHSPYEPDYRERSLTYHDCLADLLRSYGGDASAAERVRRRFAAAHGDACAPMILALEGPEARELVVGPYRPARPPDRILHELLAWSYGLGPAPVWTEDDADKLLLEPEAHARAAVRAWLAAPELLARADELPPGRLAELMRWIGARHLLDGDAAGAGAAARAERRFRWGLPSDATTLLEAAIALRAGQGDLGMREPAYQPWMRRLWLRTGTEPPTAAEHRDPYSVALYAARDGDGRALARAMSAGAFLDGDVLALWPHLRRGREDVVRQLRWSAPRAPEVPLWGQLVRSALRRDALARAGLAEESARWAAIYDRHAEALSDRRRLVALLLADR